MLFTLPALWRVQCIVCVYKVMHVIIPTTNEKPQITTTLQCRITHYLIRLWYQHVDATMLPVRMWTRSWQVTSHLPAAFFLRVIFFLSFSFDYSRLTTCCLTYGYQAITVAVLGESWQEGVLECYHIPVTPASWVGGQCCGLVRWADCCEAKYSRNISKSAESNGPPFVTMEAFFPPRWDGQQSQWRPR